MTIEKDDFAIALNNYEETKENLLKEMEKKGLANIAGFLESASNNLVEKIKLYHKILGRLDSNDGTKNQIRLLNSITNNRLAEYLNDIKKLPSNNSVQPTNNSKEIITDKIGQTIKLMNFITNDLAKTLDKIMPPKNGLYH